MALRLPACAAEADTASRLEYLRGWRWVMVYGYAERTLATIRLLETETAALLRALPSLDAEHLAWLHGIDGGGHGTHQPERRPGPGPGPFAAGPELFTVKDHPPQS